MMNNVTNLSNNELSNIMKRFPEIKLSYETIINDKFISKEYNLALAIPNEKKCYVCFSFCEDNDVLYILNLNKDKIATSGNITSCNFHSSLSLGTLLYGIILPETNVFIIEDILYFKGVSLHKNNFGEKLFYINEILSKYIVNDPKFIMFFLPMLWFRNEELQIDKIPEHVKCGYTIHHIQYKCLNEIKPSLNFLINKKNIKNRNKKTEFYTNGDKNGVSSESSYFEKYNFSKKIIKDFSKPQYKNKAIFQVSADIQCDIYHLFVYGKNKEIIYYDVAFIPNYKTSVFMNNLFRKIKENDNLDNIELSDDEEEFENLREDKYVDLKKNIFMECIFHQKFKKWVPLRVVQQPCKIVHISQIGFF